MQYDLKGRAALVTGASRGLGAAIARKLAACGAPTAVNYFGSADKAKALADRLRGEGGVAEAFGGDVRDESAVGQLVADVEKKLGPIEVLVVNATGPQPMLKLEELTWRACPDQLEFFVAGAAAGGSSTSPPRSSRRESRSSPTTSRPRARSSAWSAPGRWNSPPGASR